MYKRQLFRIRWETGPLAPSWTNLPGKKGEVPVNLKYFSSNISHVAVVLLHGLMPNYSMGLLSLEVLRVGSWGVLGPPDGN